MSAKQSTQKNKVGRPATGITKAKPSITMDEKLMKRARKAAFAEGVTFSNWVERAVRDNLAAIAAKEVAS